MSLCGRKIDECHPRIKDGLKWEEEGVFVKREKR
jgi:hypothetical protein